MTSRADRVIVAGAGPVGLTAALLLAQRGIPVTVVEADKELPQDIRAAGFHPPTLDLLEECGATRAVLDKGLICPVMQYRDRIEGRIVEFDLGLLKKDTRHPFRVQCEQYKLAAWIVDALAKIPGAEVRFSTRLFDLAQDDRGVEIAVETPSGEERIRGGYLIGADGGHSTVRRLLGIPFEGKTYTERLVTMGTPNDLREALPDLCSVNFVADNRRKPYLIFQVPGLWRIAIPIDRDVADDEAMNADTLQSALNDIAPAGAPYAISYRRIYRLHQRVAASYRVGRVFLAGDAAHLNNPAGGMGMNGGLHDAVSVAQRIGQVWHGEAGEGMLDAYEAQRRPEALNAINVQTDSNFRELVETDADVRQRMLQRWRRMAVDPALAYQHLLQTSMIASVRRAGMLS